MLFVLLVFVILLVVGREELGWPAVLLCSATAINLFAPFVCMDWPAALYCSLVTIADAILVVAIFGGDITIR